MAQLIGVCLRRTDNVLVLRGEQISSSMEATLEHRCSAARFGGPAVHSIPQNTQRFAVTNGCFAQPPTDNRT